MTDTLPQIPGLVRADAPVGAPTVTVRASTIPIAVYAAGLDQGDPVEHLQQMWRASPVLAEAVTLASPDLARRIDRVLSGTQLTTRRAEKLRLTLVRYLVRASTRATPFGVFAGVATVGTAAGPSTVQLGPEHRRHARRTDALRASATSEQTRWVRHPNAYRQADRWIVPVVPKPLGARSSASVRLTNAVAQTLTLASAPITRQTLVDALKSTNPEADETRLSGFVDELIRNGVLIPSDGRSLLQTGEPADDGVSRYATRPWGCGRETLEEILAHASDSASTIHVDTELDLRGDIPDAAIEAARSALSVLARTTLVPPGDPGLTRWTEQFEERYGTCVVPVLRALDPERGIGFPVSWSSGEQPDTSRPGIDRLLALRGVLLERHRQGGAAEITEQDLTGLPVQGGWAASYDVFLGLRRGERGTYRYVVSPIGTNFPAGRASGRFTPEMTGLRHDAAEWVRHDMEAHRHSMLADVDCLVGAHTVNDLARSAPLHPATVLINSDSQAAHTLRLADLYLAVDRGRLGVYLADGTPVEVRQPSMVAPDSYPHLVRMLYEASLGGFVRPHWSWGPVEDTVLHLPEVSAHGVVLSEQRWRFVGPKPDDSTLRSWLERSGVTRWVLVGELDNRLLLDTADAGHRALLAQALPDSRGWVAEGPCPDELGVIPSSGGCTPRRSWSAWKQREHLTDDARPRDRCWQRRTTRLGGSMSVPRGHIWS